MKGLRCFLDEICAYVCIQELCSYGGEYDSIFDKKQCEAYASE